MLKVLTIFLFLSSFVFTSNIHAAESNTDKLIELLNNFIRDPERFTEDRSKLLELINNEKYPVDPNTTSDDRDLSLLHWAAKMGDLDLVKILLSKGAIVDLPCYKKKTPLMYAIENNRDEVVRYLLEKGAGVNYTGQYKTQIYTPLSVAVFSSVTETESEFEYDTSLLKELTRRGAKDSHHNALREAIRYGYKHIVRELFSVFRNEYSLNFREENPDYTTSLLAEAYFGRGGMGMVLELIHIGADVNQADGEEETLLMELASWEPDEFNDELFSSIAELVRLGADLHGSRAQGLLMRAVQRENNDVLFLLLALGLDLDFVDFEGESEEFACLKHFGNPLNLLKFILHSARENPTLQSIIRMSRCPFTGKQKFSGETEVHSAVRSSNPHSLKHLLNQLAQSGQLAKVLNSENEEGHTPLSLAILMRRNLAVNALLDAGASPVIGNPSALTLAENIPDFRSEQTQSVSGEKTECDGEEERVRNPGPTKKRKLYSLCLFDRLIDQSVRNLAGPVFLMSQGEALSTLYVPPDIYRIIVRIMLSFHLQYTLQYRS